MEISLSRRGQSWKFPGLGSYLTESLFTVPFACPDLAQFLIVLFAFYFGVVKFFKNSEQLDLYHFYELQVCSKKIFTLFLVFLKDQNF